MFVGFNLNFNNLKIEDIDDKWFKEGRSYLKEQEIKINENLDMCINKDGTFTCESIQQGWFPKIDSHIFISHSHKDENLAIALAGCLYKTFGLKCFIDSALWGYSNKLLKLIDEKFSWLNKEKNLFDYNSRNLSTAHVHNILTLSLLQMIDKTECLFFINTTNSISVKDAISDNDYTFSPWISLELQIAKTIKKKIPHRIKNIKENEAIQKAGQTISFDMKVRYSVDTNNLEDLSINDFEKIPDHLNNKPLDTLDYLYSKKGII